MTTEGAHEYQTSGTTRYLTAALAGIVAGVVFGVMIQFVLERMTTIGALYTLGEPSLSIGWIAHLVHSGVFAIVYVGLAGLLGLEDYVDTAATGVLTGAAFGFALWFVNIGFVWPVWLNLVGVQELPVPYHLQAARPLLGHLVWGGILGALFPLVAGRIVDDDAGTDAAVTTGSDGPTDTGVEAAETEA